MNPHKFIIGDWVHHWLYDHGMVVGYCNHITECYFLEWPSHVYFGSKTERDIDEISLTRPMYKGAPHENT